MRADRYDVAASPVTTASGSASEMPTGTATESRCGWVLLTQIHGERHCSLRCGHPGNHSFTVERQTLCGLTSYR